MKFSLIGSDNENSEIFMQWIISWNTVISMLDNMKWASLSQIKSVSNVHCKKPFYLTFYDNNK